MTRRSTRAERLAAVAGAWAAGARSCGDVARLLGISPWSANGWLREARQAGTVPRRQPGAPVVPLVGRELEEAQRQLRDPAGAARLVRARARLAVAAEERARSEAAVDAIAARLAPARHRLRLARQRERRALRNVAVLLESCRPANATDPEGG